MTSPHTTPHTTPLTTPLSSPLPPRPVPTRHSPSGAPALRPLRGVAARPARPIRVAVIGNHPPRRCGIATFTRDVADGLERLGCTLHVTAMDDGACGGAYPRRVASLMDASSREAHVRAGEAIAAWAPDVVLVQHEFGIYGGPSGLWLNDVLERACAPVVATMHTVLEHPSPPEARALAALAGRAERLIVMARAGADILSRGGQGWRGIGRERIAVVPHGAPDRAMERPRDARARLGWEEAPTLLTFGLLSPGKGIEHVIDALPRILAAVPHARYVLLGATHPNLLAREGEAYRDSLVARAERLGVAAALRMVPRFVDNVELCDALAAADLYVTPYGNPAQITSGTLAYALALGKPVVSTPYAHAREVLPSDQLVPHGDAGALGERVAALLSDPARLDAITRRTWVGARGTIWPAVARRTLDVLEGAARSDASVTREAAE